MKIRPYKVIHDTVIVFDYTGQEKTACRFTVQKDGTINNINQLPNNVEAEQAVIGSVLTNNEIFDDVNTIISEKTFFDPLHQKIYSAINNLIYKGLLANPITLKNYFENEKDELNIPEYLVKITKFSTSSRQSIEYSKLIYDLFVKRELIKISDNIIDTAKLNDLSNDGKQIIESFEKSLFDLAEGGSFNSSLIKFDEAMNPVSYTHLTLPTKA